MFVSEFNGPDTSASTQVEDVLGVILDGGKEQLPSKGCFPKLMLEIYEKLDVLILINKTS